MAVGCTEEMGSKMELSFGLLLFCTVFRKKETNKLKMFISLWIKGTSPSYSEQKRVIQILAALSR